MSPLLPNWCHAAMSATDMEVVQQNYLLIIVPLQRPCCDFIACWKISVLNLGNCSGERKKHHPKAVQVITSVLTWLCDVEREVVEDILFF